MGSDARRQGFESIYSVPFLVDSFLAMVKLQSIICVRAEELL